MIDRQKPVIRSIPAQGRSTDGTRVAGIACGLGSSSSLRPGFRPQMRIPTDRVPPAEQGSGGNRAHLGSILSRHPLQSWSLTRTLLTNAVVITFLVALTTCATPHLAKLDADNDPDLLPYHLFAIHSDGEGRAKFTLEGIKGLDPSEKSTVLNECKVADEASETALSFIFGCMMNQAAKDYALWSDRGRLKSHSPLKLLLYFNGGLNSRQDVLTTAAASYQAIEHDNIFPVYMIWPTGGGGAYLENITRVRNGWEIDKKQGSGWPFYALGDVVRGIGNTPIAGTNALDEFYKQRFHREIYSLSSDDALRAAKGRPITPGANLVVTDSVDTPVKDGVPTRDDTIESIYLTATTPIRAITLPFVVGFGQTMWENMVRRSRTSVRATSEFSQDANEGAMSPNVRRDLSRFPRGSGGFGRFFQWLDSCMSNRPAIEDGDGGCPKNVRPATQALLESAELIVIGHSMGTIVVNELLSAFPNLPYSDIVYMAGAASLRDTVRSVSPVLVANHGCTHFYALMLHPWNEASELTGLGALSSGSLLVLVDELFEHPKTVGDRTVGQWRNIRAAHHLFPQEAQRWIMFRVFDRVPDLGESSDIIVPNPIEHGEFNDAGMPFWRQSFWGEGLDGITIPPPDFSSIPDLKNGSCAELFARLQTRDGSAPN